MLIQIDSNFRDYKTYPYESDFVINVNGQPPQNDSVPDVRSTYLTENYIRYAFQWIGDTAFNNPLSKIPKDTFVAKIVPLSPSSFVIVPPPTRQALSFETSDYFTGISCWNPITQLSATIVSYNNRLLIAELDADIFSVFFENISIDDIKNNDMREFIIDGYLVNPTFHEKKNLLLLGTARINIDRDNRFVLVRGIDTRLIVENVTKNWISTISSVQGVFRSVILDQFPSYDSDDFFIVYKNTIAKDVSSRKLFHNGILSFRVKDCFPDIKEGTILKWKDVEMRYIGMDKMLEIIYPGDKIEESTIRLVNPRNPREYCVIDIVELGDGVVLDYPPRINKTTFLIAFLDTIENNVYYFNIKYVQYNILYLSIDVKDIEKINLQNTIYVYFIPFFTVFPNVVVPLVPNQNVVCVEARIVTISLPNLPVCGFNIRLADFPYVLVTLCNSQGQGCEITSTLYSNVATSVRSNFVCPIANIRNPDINFVVVSSKQRAVFKFTPRDSLRFQILLPNGEILKYTTTLSKISLLQRNDELLNTEKDAYCLPLNIPLNSVRDINEKIVYPYILNNSISATFEFKIIG